VASYLQYPRAGRPDLPPNRRAFPPFAPAQASQIVEAVTDTEPVDHGLPGHGWTLKKLRQWVLTTFGRRVGRNALRRLLLAARLSWKKIKKVLGKAKPQKRIEHITRLEELSARVCRGEVTLLISDNYFSRPAIIRIPGP
jgi:transposase